MQKDFSDPSKRLGARFAAKEAVMKSLGKGWREISWKEIEVTVEVSQQLTPLVEH